MKYKSKLEERVYNALNATGYYTSGFFCVKEKMWKDIFDNAYKTKEAVDFYYPDLQLIIEVHGEQHFQPVSFGQKDNAVTLSRYENQKKRDRRLREHCEDNDIILIELHYDEIRDKNDKELSSYLESKILTAM